MKKPGEDSTVDIARSETEATGTPDDRRTSPVHPAQPSHVTESVSPARAFAPDEFVAGRYRVIRFIARGGMGEVYEVEDIELRSRIALKTIRAELADDELSLDRFRREIQLARRVTHPNVCRIFDLGHHLGRRGRITFLTMELLDGESLLRRIRERGRMTPAEALPLVQQMVAALAEAHALGIVHRDFKSDNVMLVAQPSGGLRAVVTDFGLARSAELGTSATRSGQMVGTPTYMAPEQLDSQEVGPAADQYALGVVIYEMVTGKVPFTGDTAFSVAVKRLNEPPDPPRKHVPQLDRRWERVILRCLEREPARRFNRVNDVVAALVDPTHPIAVGRPRRQWIAAAAALMALGAGIAALVLRARPPAAPSAGPRAAHHSVAVLGLRNLNQRPEAAWLQTALSELLSSELGAGERLRRVPTESVARMKRDLQLPDGESLSPETLKKVRGTLDVDYVVGGSYLALPGADGALRLDLTLQDAQSGETLSSVSQTGKEAELFDLVSRAGALLRARLGGPALSGDEAQVARRSLPASTDAARLYAEGLQKLRVGDALAARELLGQAAVADPEFPLTHAALAEAWGRLGHVADQQAEAKRAFDAAARLPRPEQLEVEAQYRVTMREWSRAIELYRALVDFYPDSIEYALDLAEVQIQAARAQDALSTLASLRKVAGGAAGDPRVDLMEAQALDLLGEFKREAEAGQRAVDEAQALGARHLLAQATLRLGYPVSATGDRARAQKLAAQASQLYDELGDPMGRANAVLRRGSLAWQAGDLPGALGLYQEGAELYRGLGADHLRSGALIDHAGVLSDLGRFDEATREYQEALSLARKLGAQKQEAAAVIAIGQQLEHVGKLAEAEARLREGLALARAIGKRNYEGVALESLGEIRLERGDPAQSLEVARQAVEVYGAIGDQTGVANARAKVGRARWWMEDPAAEEDLAAAVALLEKLGEKTHLANVRRDLAELALEAGRLGDAESIARASVMALAAAQARVPEAWSRAMLARVLVAEGKLHEARAEIDRALAAGPAELTVHVAAAIVELAERQPAPARARLEKALADPTQASGPDRLDARVVLGKAEIAAGAAAQGRARLKAVAEEARKERMVVFVRRATVK